MTAVREEPQLNGVSRSPRNTPWEGHGTLRLPRSQNAHTKREACETSIPIDLCVGGGRDLFFSKSRNCQFESHSDHPLVRPRGVPNRPTRPTWRPTWRPNASKTVQTARSRDRVATTNERHDQNGTASKSVQNRTDQSDDPGVTIDDPGVTDR